VALTSSDDLKLLFTGLSDTSQKKLYEDGTMSVEGLTESGDFTKFSEGAETKLSTLWNDIGPSKAAYEANLVVAGQLAMGINPKSGAVDLAVATQGTLNSKWYSIANQDCKAISADTGIPMDQVVAAATTLSAGRLWSGVKNGNIETARALAEIVKNPVDLKIEAKHLEFMQWRCGKSVKAVGKVGLCGGKLKEGSVSTKDLDSATLVEAAYSINALRAHGSFNEWHDRTVAGTKSASEQYKVAPPFPWFTSKGTLQVKQAVAVLRGEVTSRQSISGPKYSSFFSNISNPNKDYSSTNDCFDTETELLTQRGWLKYFEVIPGDMALTYNMKTKVGEWQAINYVYVGQAEPGNVVRISGKRYSEKSPRFDVVCTKNHNWITSSSRMPGPISRRDRTPSHSLPPSGVIHTAAPIGRNVGIVGGVKMARLLGWIHSDGSIPKNSPNKITRSQSVTVNADKYVTMLADIGAVTDEFVIKEGPYGYRDDRCVATMTVGGPAALAIRDSFTEGSYAHKTVQGRILKEEIIASMTADEADGFLDTAILGDGRTRKNNNRVWTGKDSLAADNIDAIAGIAGFNTKRYVSPSGDIHVSILKPRPIHVDALTVTEELYDGLVWCPNLDNGTAYFRRAGRTFFSGQTWHYRVMAGNSPLHNKGSRGSMKELTLDSKGTKKAATAQDIFQRGAGSVKDHIAPGDGMFRDTTKITRNALNTLKTQHPDQFSRMKIHEFQALIWVHYGGGLSSDADRTGKWFGALETMKAVGL
jgi:hypothetical protein